MRPTYHLFDLPIANPKSTTPAPWATGTTIRKRWLRSVLGIVLALPAMSPGVSQALEWPTRPVTIIVPFVAGGNTDMMARLAAEQLSAKFGQPFIIENRAGAGGVTGAAQVARSAPDGYTFLFGAGSQLVLAPLVQKVAYDPDKDLIPITEFGTGPQILGVKDDMPVNTLQEFIDYAKARPGKLTYAGVGVQTVTAIAAGVLIARSGLSMTLVPYKGGVQALGDLLAGHVDMYFGNASEMLPHLNSGKIRLLAVRNSQSYPAGPRPPDRRRNVPGFRVRLLERLHGAGRNAARDHRQAGRGLDRGGEHAIGQGEARAKRHRARRHHAGAGGGTIQGRQAGLCGRRQDDGDHAGIAQRNLHFVSAADRSRRRIVTIADQRGHRRICESRASSPRYCVP